MPDFKQKDYPERDPDMSAKLATHIHSDNIAKMYSSTAIAMIFTALTGVIAVLIDGIVTSRFLGSDIYSGIALLRPFTSVVMMLAGFISTGCSFVCSHLIGRGEKEEANRAFNLSVAVGLLFAAVLILAVIVFPSAILQLCGVSLTKYPELNHHMYGYLHGYIIGLPAIMLLQVIGPILVMDNGKRLFTISSVLLCVADILGDLLNVFAFHGGAYGMGLATSVGYIFQLLILLLHFRQPNHFFRLSPKLIRSSQLREVIQGGSPAFLKRAASTLRDIVINHLNLMASMTTAAIAARGIQSDLFQFLFCIATGLGRTLVTMTGMYYAADDMQGLKRLYSYSMKFGVQITVVAGAFAFVAARPLAQLYTGDAEVLTLSVFSIRWMAMGLVFDVISTLQQHYLQGIKNLKLLNVLCFAERFFVPVAVAFVLGRFHGTKGILASTGISKVVLVLLLFLYLCFRCRGLPKRWEDLMFLPEGFGGREADNMYAFIRTPEDAVQESKCSYDFCLEHGAEKRKAYYLSLCVEEMAMNILNHAEKAGLEKIYADFRLCVSDSGISFSLRDISDKFDPTAFYALHLEDSPEAHLGIRMVTKIAKEIRYFSAYDSNNLIISI